MIGDPSGRSEERNLLDDATLDHNVAAIKAPDQPHRRRHRRPWPARRQPRLDPAGRACSSSSATSASTPPSTRCWPARACKVRLGVRARASRSPSSATCSCRPTTTCWLHDHLGCELQIGGSDQCGNILSGVDLIRRKRHVAVHAWPGRCSPPPTAASSARRPAPGCGSTRRKTSPYQFHQHWMQLDDRQLDQQLQVLLAAPGGRDRRARSPSTRPRPSAGSPSGRSPTR